MASETNGRNLNSRYELVILNKVDSEGNYNLLHAKPLNVELYCQVPDSLLVFTTGKFAFNSSFKCYDIDLL